MAELLTALDDYWTSGLVRLRDVAKRSRRPNRWNDDLTWRAWRQVEGSPSSEQSMS